MGGLLLLAIGALVGGVTVAVLSDLISEELRTRLDRLPFAILALAARRLPRSLRSSVYENEWLPELQWILEELPGLPIQRLVVGVRYSCGQLLAARAVARELAYVRGRISAEGSQQETIDRRRALSVVEGLAVTVAFVLAAATTLSGPWADNLVQILASSAAGFACLRCAYAARRQSNSQPGEFLGWSALAVGCFCWSAGVVVWGYFQVILKQELPSPSIADVGFFLLVPAFLLAISAFYGVTSRARVVKLMACVSVVVLIAVVLGFTIVGSGPSDSGIALVVAMSYPLGDMCVAVTALILARKGRRAGPLIAVGTCASILAVSDSMFLFLVYTGADAMPLFYNAGFYASFLVLTWFALRLLPRKSLMASSAL